MGLIKSDADLNRFILDIICKEVVEEVSDKMLFRLQTNIMKYVYLAQNNASYYAGTGAPTLEFYRAWDFTPMKDFGRSIVTELFYNPSKMRYEPDNYLHGNAIYGDARDTLMDILNVKGNTNTGKGHPFLIKITSAPYWDNTIKEFFNRRRISIDVHHAVVRISRQLRLKISRIK